MNRVEKDPRRKMDMEPFLMTKCGKSSHQVSLQLTQEQQEQGLASTIRKEEAV